MSVTTPGTQSAYYIPQPSHWPIVGAIALLLMGMGAAFWIKIRPRPYMTAAGFRVLVYICSAGS